MRNLTDPIHTDVLQLVDQADEDAYKKVGELLDKGDLQTCKSLVCVLWEEVPGVACPARDLALECLACYGTKHFQSTVDSNVFKALFSDADRHLLFSAIASYSLMSQNAQDDYLSRLNELKSHSHENIARAAKAQLEYQQRNNCMRD